MRSTPDLLFVPYLVSPYLRSTLPSYLLAHASHLTAQYLLNAEIVRETTCTNLHLFLNESLIRHLPRALILFCSPPKEKKPPTHVLLHGSSRKHVKYHDGGLCMHHMCTPNRLPYRYYLTAVTRSNGPTMPTFASVFIRECMRTAELTCANLHNPLFALSNWSVSLETLNPRSILQSGPGRGCLASFRALHVSRNWHIEGYPTDQPKIRAITSLIKDSLVYGVRLGQTLVSFY